MTAAAMPLVASFEASGREERANFELLMRRHERMVLATALRLAGNSEDARDISQEVFLKLYRNLGKVDPGNVAGWLYRVTVNQARDVRRRRARTPEQELPPTLRANAADPEQAAGEAERQRALARSLHRLSERERTALTLRDIEGLSTEEIARLLGSTQATVRSQTSKARAKVREFMDRYFRRRV